MKKLLIIFLLLTSCNVKKEASKTKIDRTVSEISERTIKRKGDTVTYVVPKVTYKDTTIYTVNQQGTVLKTIYDDAGKISLIDCYSSLIDITERNSKNIEEFIKAKEKEKEEEVDDKIVLYIVLGWVLVVFITIFFIFKYISNQTKSINDIIDLIK